MRKVWDFVREVYSAPGVAVYERWTTWSALLALAFGAFAVLSGWPFNTAVLSTALGLCAWTLVGSYIAIGRRDRVIKALKLTVDSTDEDVAWMEGRPCEFAGQGVTLAEFFFAVGFHSTPELDRRWANSVLASLFGTPKELANWLDSPFFDLMKRGLIEHRRLTNPILPEPFRVTDTYRLTDSSGKAAYARMEKNCYHVIILDTKIKIAAATVSG